MAAAAGRRLGEVVSTGLPNLDERIIIDISEIGEHGFTLWEAAMDLEIRLAPDLVKLGYPKGPRYP
ncbi:hypothetical protein SPMU_06600 [Sphingomonas mucosissima]|uniref:Uncharacterized protein n=2 Tax=Sphingomonas mucosissima TaxID=370959 RepID=A0A245ZRH4_9SPHN|nr:hypothetical protein SPMU_06600 [Sphingomonas mucosissima]